jgi:predicted ATPase
LKHVIGEQPPVPELPPSEAQRRFQLVFRRFIGVFARPEHPLALFLDDLQWLDAATLDLIEDLLTRDDLRHLLLIGAYRDNEVSATHPLVRKLDAIRQAGAAVEDIVLTPLAEDDLRQLLVDCLHCEPERAAPLAKLIHEKTSGNPFFAIQFISTLADEGLLSFDYSEGRWVWDLNSHSRQRLHRQRRGTPGRKVEPPASRHAGGTQAVRLHGKQRRVRHAGDGLREADRGTSPTPLGSSTDRTYLPLGRFLPLPARSRAGSSLFHDSATVRSAAHLRIGMLLAAHTPAAKREEAIFEIVNQLNRGSHLSPRWKTASASQS